ncbi:hypothetical protein PR202_gb13720 [Eleusine coracana subsp. coracana]|uniref:Wall-associated receptor kinase galacturonan-binding domain-containing protein n=1 Tax=Eleusine coracana subsp. coracana TaxID=191504 RepID=A0AAV5ETV6_ELECO|nr:hypothetical protein PR202_gb13720 [Eleusine coracana subsp. coracana]
MAELMIGPLVSTVKEGEGIQLPAAPVQGDGRHGRAAQHPGYHPRCRGERSFPTRGREEGAPQDQASATPPPSSCQRRCGDLDIPYPFGIGNGCYLNLTADGSYKAFCYEVEVTDIFLSRGQARIRSSDFLSWCYNSTSKSMGDTLELWNDFTDEANRFTVVGCNSLAYVQSVNTGPVYMTGCMATCPDAGRLENGSCSGMGCCQAAIPRGINTYQLRFDDRFNTSGVTAFSPCSYAVLVEAAAFDFRTTFVKSTGGKVPLVLDWVVGKETCR